jgi:hypothetical protein
MTENHWLSCDSPVPLLEHLKGKVSDRKLRLFACHCLRRVWHFLDDDRKQQLQTFERDLTDWPIGTEKWQLRFGEHRTLNDAIGQVKFGAAWAAAWNLSGEVCASLGKNSANQRQAEHQWQTSLVREMFGNPFRRVIVFPYWRTATVGQLADAIYVHEDFAGLPILSDALEEAGCDNMEILAHLRQPGPHIRGCWALDLVLDKE